MDKTRPTRWLLKTEPETYSFQQLEKDKNTHWNGVRNFQARNFLKQMAIGDLAVIYHSGEERSAVGIAKVIRSAYPDPDPKKKGDWVQVDIQAVEPMARAVPLSEMKANSSLKNMLLIKQSRLSVMPISAQEFKVLTELGSQKMSRGKR